MQNAERLGLFRVMTVKVGRGALRTAQRDYTNGASKQASNAIEAERRERERLEAKLTGVAKKKDGAFGFDER